MSGQPAPHEVARPPQRRAANIAPIVGLGTSGGYGYAGELTGEVFRVKL